MIIMIMATEEWNNKRVLQLICVIDECVVLHVVAIS